VGQQHAPDQVVFEQLKLPETNTPTDQRDEQLDAETRPVQDPPGQRTRQVHQHLERKDAELPYQAGERAGAEVEGQQQRDPEVCKLPPAKRNSVSEQGPKRRVAEPAAAKADPKHVQSAAAEKHAQTTTERPEGILDLPNERTCPVQVHEGRLTETDPSQQLATGQVRRFRNSDRAPVIWSFLQVFRSANNEIQQAGSNTDDQECT